MGFEVKELEQTQNGVNIVKSGATRYTWGSEILDEQSEIIKTVSNVCQGSYGSATVVGGGRR